MPQRFIIDVNLPRRFHLWASSEFEFAHDAQPSWSDEAVWDCAVANDLIIVTIDGDFHDRRVLSDAGPKIIHFRLRDMRMREWHAFVTTTWPRIRSLIDTHRMVIVYRDRIDAIP